MGNKNHHILQQVNNSKAERGLWDTCSGGLKFGKITYICFGEKVKETKNRCEKKI